MSLTLTKWMDGRKMNREEAKLAPNADIWQLRLRQSFLKMSKLKRKAFGGSDDSAQFLAREERPFLFMFSCKKVKNSNIPYFLFMDDNFWLVDESKKKSALFRKFRGFCIFVFSSQSNRTPAPPCSLFYRKLLLDLVSFFFHQNSP